MGRKKELSLIEMNRKKNVKAETNCKKKFVDGVNQRADRKQDDVVNVFKDILGETCTVDKIDLCHKVLNFEHQNMLKYIDISYYTTNSVFARIFDLILTTQINSSCPELLSDERDNIAIGVDFKGSLRISGMSLIPVKKSIVASKLAEVLNTVSLINDRTLYMEATDIRVEYDVTQKKWIIGMATGKGSTVWSMMPPVVMLIKFTALDAIRTIELFQLIIHEIKKFEANLLKERK